MRTRVSCVCAVLVLAAWVGAAHAQLMWNYVQNDHGGSVATIGIHGTLPGPGPFDEIAVEQHVLHPGDLVPLPTFPDGTMATDDETFWTAHVWEARFSKDYCSFPATYITGDHCTITFNGRQSWAGLV